MIREADIDGDGQINYGQHTHSAQAHSQSAASRAARRMGTAALRCCAVDRCSFSLCVLRRLRRGVRQDDDVQLSGTSRTKAGNAAQPLRFTSPCISFLHYCSRSIEPTHQTQTNKHSSYEHRLRHRSIASTLLASSTVTLENGDALRMERAIGVHCWPRCGPSLELAKISRFPARKPRYVLMSHCLII